MHKNTRFPSPVFLKIWTGVIIKIKNFENNFFFEKMELLDQASHHLFGKEPSKIYGVSGPGLRTGGLKVFFGHQMIHVSQIAKKQQKTR